jgi:DNA-binding Lrp family transcriptional regulator
VRPGVARPLHLIHGGASSYCARQLQSSPAPTHRNRPEAWPLDRCAFGGAGALRGGAGALRGAALGLDGRTSYAALAKQADWTEGRVIRRVEALREVGILYFDVDLASTVMGFKAPAYLWLIVEPARLAAVGEEISRHAEVPFAAAITGSANLVASVVCRDSEALYEYMTTKISAAAGVRQLEISPS